MPTHSEPDQGRGFEKCEETNLGSSVETYTSKMGNGGFCLSGGPYVPILYVYKH